MRYKTVIEIVCEADNDHEALDIAGEFLKGDLEAGIEMQCFAKPVNDGELAACVQ